MDYLMEQDEKLQKVKRFGWRDIVAIASYLFIMFIVTFLVMLFLTFMYIAQNQGTDIDITAVSNELLMPLTIWSTFISGILNVIVIFCLYWRLIKNEWKTFWGKWKRNILVIILGYVFVFLFELFFSHFISSETSANQQTIETMFANASGFEMLLLQIPVVFCAPITEEFVCRKALFGSFKDNKIVGTIMLVVSSVIFGLLHYGYDGNFLLLIPYIVMGAVLAGVYWFTDNIFTAIGLHFLNNGLASILILLLPLLG